MRKAAAVLLILATVTLLLAGVIAPYSYGEQLRDDPDATASARHWLGTDGLGRDRLSRLLYGRRLWCRACWRWDSGWRARSADGASGARWRRARTSASRCRGSSRCWRRAR